MPPIVPRFWIWAAPIVAAASTSAGSVLGAERRSTDLRVGREGAEHQRPVADRDPAQLVDSRHRSSTRSGGGPISPVIWTSRSVPPASGRWRPPAASVGLASEAGERPAVDGIGQATERARPGGSASAGPSPARGRRPAARQRDRLDDLGVAGAAAQVARRSPRGSRSSVGAAGREERLAGHEHPRRADPALRAAGLEERLLERSEACRASARPRAALRPSGRPPVDLADGHQAAVHDRAVDEHRARAALALAAALLRARSGRGPRGGRRAGGASRVLELSVATPLTVSR